MTISELVAKLEEIRKQHGDLPVEMEWIESDCDGDERNVDKDVDAVQLTRGYREGYRVVIQ